MTEKVNIATLAVAGRLVKPGFEALVESWADITWQIAKEHRIWSRPTCVRIRLQHFLAKELGMHCLASPSLSFPISKMEGHGTVVRVKGVIV